MFSHSLARFVSDYGENYFVHNPEVYGQIPIHSSYTSADKLLGSYVHTRDRICREWGPNDARHCQLHDDWYALLQDLRSVWVSRTLNALPEDPNVVDENFQGWYSVDTLQAKHPKRRLVGSARRLHGPPGAGTKYH